MIGWRVITDDAAANIYPPPAMIQYGQAQIDAQLSSIL
jgi:hypothetical protein